VKEHQSQQDCEVSDLRVGPARREIYAMQRAELPPIAWQLSFDRCPVSGDLDIVRRRVFHAAIKILPIEIRNFLDGQIDFTWDVDPLSR